MTIESVGIIGLGSIGRRHARLLASLIPGVRIHAHRTGTGALRDRFADVIEVDEAAFWSSTFDLVVIANPSSLHLQTLERVLRAGLGRVVLVEKPFCLPAEAADAARLIGGATETRVLPGNSLRFHPAVDGLKRTLREGRLGAAIECHAHFGTYMPGWHPYEDYRTTYAARREMGGGVLLTSIHEIDLVHHLFGDGAVAAAVVGRLALDETDVEDTAHLLLRLERCGVANVSLNFFERPSDRYLKVVFERGAWSWTFGRPEAIVTMWDGSALVETRYDVATEVDAMYLNMWQRALGGDFDDFDMASVFSSLKTVQAACDIGEGNGWT